MLTSTFKLCFYVCLTGETHEKLLTWRLPLALQALVSEHLVQDAASFQSAQFRRVFTDDGHISIVFLRRQVTLTVGQRAQQRVVLVGWEIIPETTTGILNNQIINYTEYV